MRPNLLRVALLALALIAMLCAPAAVAARAPKKKTSAAASAPLGGVTLELDDLEGWVRQSSGESRRQAAYREEVSGMSVQLLAFDLGENRGSKSAQALITDWLGQLTATDSRVQVAALEPVALSVRDGQPLQLMHAELVFEDRVAFFYGFSSADLGSPQASSVPDDRYAFILLLEAPLAVREQLRASSELVVGRLSVPRP